MESQKRTPIKPRESMKDIIYGGSEIGSENENPQKVSFRVRLWLTAEEQHEQYFGRWGLQLFQGWEVNG